MGMLDGLEARLYGGTENVLPVVSTAEELDGPWDFFTTRDPRALGVRIENVQV